jgi:hypothetical protein
MQCLSLLDPFAMALSLFLKTAIMGIIWLLTWLIQICSFTSDPCIHLGSEGGAVRDIAGIPQALRRSGCPVKAIWARLKGKEGQLQGNLMGKHVDFSTCTVITGDPNLELDEVGISRSITMNLTYPERGLFSSSFLLNILILCYH